MAETTFLTSFYGGVCLLENELTMILSTSFPGFPPTHL